MDQSPSDLKTTFLTRYHISVLLVMIMAGLLIGCGGASDHVTDTGSGTPTDTSTDTPTDADTDTETATQPNTTQTNIGQISGGGLGESPNYTLKLTVGGAPMNTNKSPHYTVSLGTGAVIKPNL